MMTGTLWAKRIDEELKKADYLITFLSPHSILSEMIEAEIETAHLLSKERGGRPTILPVRLAYEEPLKYPLSAYLNRFNWASWQDLNDTPNIIKELKRALSDGMLTMDKMPLKASQPPANKATDLPQPLPSAQPVLEMPEGTMGADSTFYVARKSDNIALDAITRQGVTITIKGSRQMGKSSVMIRMIEAAAKAGKRIAHLDFQLLDHALLKSGDQFFRNFCTWLTDELGLTDRITEFWRNDKPNTERCTNYMGQYILKKLGKPLVLAMDEVDRVLNTEFRSDFFGMLRSWHNRRAKNPAWKQLDLALVISTEPYQLIADIAQSPFNVGEVIQLEDFTLAQVADLNDRHGSAPWNGSAGLPKGVLNGDQVRQLMELLHGHPYLVRRALYLVAGGRITTQELFNKAAHDDGPFGDHLRYHLFRLHGQKKLVTGLRRIIKRNACKDEDVLFRLRSAGLVRSEETAVVPRCKLYADYFRRHLNVSNKA